MSFGDARQVRDARNQSFFRDLNERIAVLQRSRTFVEFACECSDQTCAGRVVLSIDEYESVRGSATTFVVAPGHVCDTDTVLTANDRYAVVTARGLGADVAADLNPRR